jgi:type IV pilus assembly protein PilB
MEKFSEKLIDYLVKGDFITQEQALDFQKLSEIRKISFEEVLLEKEIFTDQQLGQVIADIHQWKFVDLTQEVIDKQVLNLIPAEVAKAQNVIAFGLNGERIKIAMGNPDNSTLVHLLQKTLGRPVIIYFSTPQAIKKSLYHYQKEIKDRFAKLIESHAQEAAFGEARDSAIVKIVDLLFWEGYKKGASDIHIEPQLNIVSIRFRIDGVMHDIVSLPKAIHTLLVTRLKVLSKLRTDEHQAPQDGKIQFKFEDENADIRVSILPTTKGENIVLRLLSETSGSYSLEELGLAERDYNILRENIKKPWGLILATGPTGSGKTTSLYAILKILNRREVHIATIEDPVEYNMDNLTQVQVNPKAKLTFASGLRSIVRQDPNIIMVGEIRDEETASIAVNSAMTGHLVLSTLHTNDAATTLPRLSDMKIQPFLVSSTVNIAIAQRLLRKICQKCIYSYEVTPAELQKTVNQSVVEQLSQGKPKILLYKGKGCPVCHNSGYSGRIGVFEVLEMSNDIRELILKNADSDQIKTKAIEAGMTTMFEDALAKVRRGVTTVEEMLRVIKD